MMMRVQRFFLGLLLTTSLLAMSMLTTGCYTQFATTNSIERISSPTEVDVEELVESGANVTINNYYDSYYARFLRPTIYGFGGVWNWYDPFWDYPLWYTPVVAWYGFAPLYYGWGGWGWRAWAWNPYFPPYWGGGGVASTEPLGTRRIGIGRTRLTGATGNASFSSPTRYGTSSEGRAVTPANRRQRDGSYTAPADASRRSTGRAVERQSDGKSRESYTAPSRRQSSGERRTPSYSTPTQRSSPPASTPSRGGSGGSSNSSSSGSSGRRQR